MADPYVIFPGTPAGNYLSTPDVNLLDADSAHLQQSVGGWEAWTAAGAITQAQILAPVFGEYHGAVTTSGTNSGVIVSDVWDSGVVDVDGSTEYTMVAYVATTDGADVRLRVASRPDAGGVTSFYDGAPSASAVGTLTRLAFTFTTVAGTTLARPIIEALTATTIYFDAICLREGSDTEFVPSLRIVGSLYEEIVPADMPISFAGDGTPLTVGDGWAGDGYSYRRYDGADASTPVVAEFLASDIPVAAQLPG